MCNVGWHGSDRVAAAILCIAHSTLNYAQKRGEIVASVFRPHCGDIKTRFTFSSMRCLDTVDVSNRVGTMIFK